MRELPGCQDRSSNQHNALAALVHAGQDTPSPFIRLDKLKQFCARGVFLVHPELNSEIVALQEDSRTYTLQGAAGLSSIAAGEFKITQFTSNGKDFTAATIKLDFNKILNGKGVTPADFNLGYNKFGGLNDNARRMAELVGHEFAHGLFALRNPADATQNQQLGTDIDRMLNALPVKHRYPLPPDLEQKLDAYV